MEERWTPPLELRESAGRCRLSLVGVTHGQGLTLQEAADDLIAQVVRVALSVRSSGIRVAPDLGRPDFRLYAFLYELGEMAARREDIRERLFGGADESDLAA